MSKATAFHFSVSRSYGSNKRLSPIKSSEKENNKLVHNVVQADMQICPTSHGPWYCDVQWNRWTVLWQIIMNDVWSKFRLRHLNLKGNDKRHCAHLVQGSVPGWKVRTQSNNREPCDPESLRTLGQHQGVQRVPTCHRRHFAGRVQGANSVSSHCQTRFVHWSARNLDTQANKSCMRHDCTLPVSSGKCGFHRTAITHFCARDRQQWNPSK